MLVACTFAKNLPNHSPQTALPLRLKHTKPRGIHPATPLAEPRRCRPTPTALCCAPNKHRRVSTKRRNGQFTDRQPYPPDQGLYYEANSPNIYCGLSPHLHHRYSRGVRHGIRILRSRFGQRLSATGLWSRNRHNQGTERTSTDRAPARNEHGPQHGALARTTGLRPCDTARHGNGSRRASALPTRL